MGEANLHFGSASPPPERLEGQFFGERGVNRIGTSTQSGAWWDGGPGTMPLHLSKKVHTSVSLRDPRVVTLFCVLQSKC